MTASAAAAAPTNLEVIDIPLGELSPSRFNSRAIKEDDKLRELADSIRTGGVNQPIIVREVPVEGDVIEYEIVAGHRRFHASRLAGKGTIPAIIRELTDDQARELQITENLHREDLDPLDEARAFNEAMTFASLKLLSVQELAARLGKSPVYISRRLTLLDAIPAVQDALRQRLIEVGHALDLARLQEAEQQRLLYWLGVVEEKDDVEAGEDNDEDEYEDEEEEEEDDESPLVAQDAVRFVTTRSVIDLRKHIGQTALRVLGTAPFDPGDADLDPEAGSCADCLKRTGGSPLLFSDVSDQDVCTDRACFDGKIKTLTARRIAEAKAAGNELIQVTTDWQNKSKGGARYQHDVDIVGRYGCAPCEASQPGIYVDGKSVGKLIQVCVHKTCPIHKGRNNSSSTGADPKAKEKRKALLAKVKAEKQYRLQLFKELMAKPIAPEPTDAMVKALVGFAFTRLDSTKYQVIEEALAWPKGSFGWAGDKNRASRMAALTQADAIRSALVALGANELTVHEQELEAKRNNGNARVLGLEEVAKMLGVDVAPVRERFFPGAMPAAAKAVPAKKAAKKKVMRK